ncbi:MAG: NHLP leader peptide family RiPP precursor [Candidatus Nanopelagicales bacterium]
MDYTELQIKAATDHDFRMALLNDPAAALAEVGLELPSHISIRVMESTPEEIVLAIPPLLPDGTEIDEDVLADTAAGLTPLMAFGLPAWAVVASYTAGAASSLAIGYTAGQTVKGLTKK